jgi:2-iminobutanoate/2-iminopropanoate deaminase
VNDDRECPRLKPQQEHNAMSRAVNPPEANIPGISQAVIVEGGNLVFLSGHVPIKSTGAVAGPDLETQLNQVFVNIGQTLTASGIGYADIVRLTIYTRDHTPTQLPLIRAVRDGFIDAAKLPASALIGVAALFHPDVLVEIDAIAAFPRRES